jgi:predicted amidohydrolase
MVNLKIATAQFENASGNKDYNLGVIRKLTEKAVNQGSRIVAFHECSISGYTFVRNFSREQMLKLAEYVPEGESIVKLKNIAAEFDVTLLAGLFEKEKNGSIFNTYVCVDKNGLVTKYRKLHPFINPNLNAGDRYVLFNLYGWKCGILICYDNNIIENVRATCLLGADIIFMPHITMCTPSSRPGAGFVDPKLWENRETDPTSLRLEFDGMKGRSWLIKWLPARAYDNAIYVIFSNPIGMDDDQLKNGCSMIIDPFGDIIAECRTLGDDVITALITSDKLTQAGGFRYRNARRPELYGHIISKSHQSKQEVIWLKQTS